MANDARKSTGATRSSVLPEGLRNGASRLSGRMLPFVAVFASLGVFAPGYLSATTSIEKGVIFISGWIAHLIVSFLGQLLLVLIGALIWVAQYNGFIDSPAVVNGWSIMRDVANMFFIVVLLVIAFGTMIGYGNYDYRSRLPTLLIMAVVVNFSRTICGLLIDFAQVVMLTFVHGFDQAAGGNFTQAFGINNLLALRANAPTENADFSIVISFFLAVALAGISVLVIIVMLAVLVARIVMLWLLVVLSPLAFLAKSAPFSSGQGMYGKWWGEFTQNVLVGPFMAFFLWLSMISVAGGALATQGFPANGPDTETFSGGSSEAFTEASIQQFIIAIALLLGGTQMSLQMGGMAGGFGSMAKGVTKSAARGLARGTYRAGVGASRIAGRTALRTAGALGGAKLLDRGSGALLTAGTKVPLVRDSASRAIARRNAAKKAMEKRESAFVDDLSAQNRVDLLKGYMGRGKSLIMSPKDEAVKKKLLQGVMGDVAGGSATDDTRAKFHEYRAELEKMAGDDDDVKKELTNIDKKKPSLIVDSNADAKAQEAQLERYRKVVGGMNAKDVAALKADEITPDLVSAFGQGRAERMIKDGKAPKEVIDALKNAVQGSASFAYLNDEQKADRVKGISAEDAKKLPTAAIDANAARAMGDAGFAAVANDLKKMNISAGDLSSEGNRDLAERFAKAMDAGAIGKLPNEMRSALAGALSSGGDDAGALAVAKKMEDVFTSFNGKNGNFGDAGDLKRFAAMMEKPGAAKTLAENSSAKQIGRNGGVSEMGLEMISNIDVGDVKAMFENGDDAQAAAVLRAAERIQEMGEGGVAGAAIESGVTTSDEVIAKAVKNAEKLIEEAGKRISPTKFESRVAKATREAAAAARKNTERAAKWERKRESRGA